MKKIFTYILPLLGLILTVSPIAAQINYSNRIYINSAELKEENGLLNLDFTINTNAIDLDTDKSLILTPIIAGTQNVEFPSIMINGNMRHRAYLRALNNNHEKTVRNFPYTVVKPEKGSDGLVRYTHSIPFESWMSSAQLNMREDWCGCGKENANLITGITNVQFSVIPEPIVAYVQPAGEAIKARSKSIDVFLDFPVNQTIIRPEYMNNPQELAKINNMLEELRGNSDLNVKEIAITGYASPEGSVSGNERLSQGRANALRDYLVNRGYFPQNLFTLHYGGENWSGLLQAVENSHYNYRSEVISIINNTYDVNRRKNELKALGGGAPYRQLLNEVYPKLRKAICHANFEVRNYTVDEAKEIIKTNPEYLSLNEMYYVANSYPKGSQSFNDVFETAIRMYPDDPVANLNIAATALEQNNFSKADSYLRKANQSSAEYANNLGIYYMYTGDLERARSEFQKAASGGFNGAQQNLEILQRVVQTGKLPNSNR